MSTYVIGDVHGEYEQLVELVEKMHITEEDSLYILGDVIDRGPEPVKALEYLMTIPNCTCLAGNHEMMMLSNIKMLLSEITEDYLDDLSVEELEPLLEWLHNGASNTISDFAALSVEEREEIIDFVKDFEVYVELEVNGQRYLLVHAGLDNFSKEKKLDEYYLENFVWTRLDYGQKYYDDVIMVTGHTPTQVIPKNPNPGYIYKANNHIALDCAACSESGRLAGICLETGEEFYARK